MDRLVHVSNTLEPPKALSSRVTHGCEDHHRRHQVHTTLHKGTNVTNTNGVCDAQRSGPNEGPGDLGMHGPFLPTACLITSNPGHGDGHMSRGRKEK